MDDLTIHVGVLDRSSRTVPVTFTSGEFVHERSVNAVMKNNGTHDRAATIERVNDVARGIADKIKVGAITSPLPPAAAEPQSD